MHLGIAILISFVVGTAALPQGSQLPPLNQKVLEFVEANMGKKVGRGECWDLASEALQHAGAVWDGKYTFGRCIDPTREEVLPGDIAQFENVYVKDRTGNVLREERMAKHTAVIHEVHEPGIFTLAHQNTDVTGKKVGKSRFLMKSVVRGKVLIYRPTSDAQ
jgi:hypothetical protein